MTYTTSIVLGISQQSLEPSPSFLKFPSSQDGQTLTKNPNLQDSKQMSYLLKIPERNKFFFSLLSFIIQCGQSEKAKQTICNLQ